MQEYEKSHEDISKLDFHPGMNRIGGNKKTGLSCRFNVGIKVFDLKTSIQSTKRIRPSVS